MPKEKVVEKETEVEEKKENRFSESAVITQTEPVILDNDELNEDGKPQQYTIYSALTRLLNDVDELKKGLL